MLLKTFDVEDTLKENVRDSDGEICVGKHDE